MPKSVQSLVPVPVLEAVADYFKILSETSRLHILQCLRQGPMNVMELCEATGLGQANLSKHLKVMAQAGVLSRRAKGTSAYYEITDPLVFEFCELACGRIGDRLRQQAETFQQLNAFQPSPSAKNSAKKNKVKATK
ncbi:MAG: ArsR/SmtB family transcription factor [Leptolyngbya sp. BL-A-14]